MIVARKVNGMAVEAVPRFNGRSEPDYWVAVVNNRIIFRKFKSPTELFRFVERQYQSGERSRTPRASRYAVASS